MTNILLRLFLIYIPVIFLNFNSGQLNLWLSLVFCIEVSLHPHRLLQQVFLRQIRKNINTKLVINRFFLLYFFSSFIPAIYSYFFLSEYEITNKIIICLLLFFLSFVQIFSNFPRVILNLDKEQKYNFFLNLILVFFISLFLYFTDNLVFIFCTLIFLLILVTVLISFLSNGYKIYSLKLKVINDTNQFKELFNFIIGSLLTTFSVMLFVYLWKQGNIVDLSDNELSMFFVMNSASQLAYYFFSSNLPRIYAKKSRAIADKSIIKNRNIFIFIFFIGQIFLYLIYPYILNFKISTITFFSFIISLLSLRYVQICLVQLREHGHIFYFHIGFVFFVLNILCWFIFSLFKIEHNSINFIIYFSSIQLLTLLVFVDKINFFDKISKLYIFILSSNLILLFL
jgi:hypothetical protein